MRHLQPAIDILTDGRISKPGVAAHRRFVSLDKDGQPTHMTERRPACLPKPAEPEPTRWAEYGGSRAVELGATPCTAAECFPGGAA